MAFVQMKMKRAFTLIELLVVVAIMGLLGTTAVGGYRAMQRGMEERGVMQNVNQFIRSAYQRAQIDRVPVAVYFWNETLQEETDSSPLVVVGRAVAVRRAGRITNVTGSYLYDEFGDLRFNRLVTDEDSEEETDNASGSSEDSGCYLYPMNGTSDGTNLKRSLISQSTVHRISNEDLLLGGVAQIESYAFYVQNANGVTWKRGDAYGFEFAEIQLPHGFLFGSSYSKSISSPVDGETVIRFSVGANTGSGTTGGFDTSPTIQVSSLRPGSSGEIEALRVGTSDRPDKSLSN